jgi:hypothetical protein
VNVGAEGFEGRDVHHAHFVGQRRGDAFLNEVVECLEKRRERLAGAGRRGNQRVLATADGLPAAALRDGRLTEGVLKPTRNDGMKMRKRKKLKGKRKKLRA